MRREICGDCGAPISDDGACDCTELLKRGWRQCAAPAATADEEGQRERAETAPAGDGAQKGVVAWARLVCARPVNALESAEEWDEMVDVEFHTRPEKPEGEGWYPLVVGDRDLTARVESDTTLLRQALERLKAVVEHFAPYTGVNGQPMENACYTIAALRERLGEKS